MFLSPDHFLIRYTGRWYVTPEEVSSTANGNYLEYCFVGDTSVIHFNTEHCQQPFPHVYICVDAGAYIEAPIHGRLRISAEPGTHTVQLVLKSSLESQNRWTEPLVAKVGITGIEADAFLPLPPDDRPVIEFIGDSITEGTLVDGEDDWTAEKLIYMNDALAGYAWRTAKLLNMRPVTMGYGRLGTTIEGNGGVPPAEQSYPCYFQDHPMPCANADVIVINYGTNDNRNGAEVFKPAYARFLASVRARNTDAVIFCIAPFGGFLNQETLDVVLEHNRKYNDNIHHIDTAGWTTPVPTHPLRDTCKDLSKRLAAEIKKVLQPQKW